jgi:hypothetical protein
MKIMNDGVNQNERGATMPMKTINNYKDVGGQKISRGTFNVVERFQDTQQFYHAPVERKDLKEVVLNGIKIRLVLGKKILIDNFKRRVCTNFHFEYDKDYYGSPVRGYPAQINIVCNTANSLRNVYSQTFSLSSKSGVVTPIEIYYNELIKEKMIINCTVTVSVYGRSTVRKTYNLSSLIQY